MKAWQYKVVKQMRGMRGEWFDFPTAATFDDEAAARVYAEQFAREQGAAGVRGARIAVRSRKQRLNEAGWPTHNVATYKSDDYLHPTGAEIRQAREEAGQTQAEAAASILVATKTWQDYELMTWRSSRAERQP